MNAEILIVTFKRDFRYLKFCLESIRRFATGFSGITLVVPDYDAAQAVLEFSGVTIKSGAEWPDNPMLWHEWVIMNADQWCPKADYVVHLDADCLVRAPVSPDTYIRDGKPYLRHEPFADVATREPGVMEWERVTRLCLPFENLQETMRAMPLVYHRSTYPLTRKVMTQKTKRDAGEYIRSCKGIYPQGFCEFVTLGNVAMNLEREKYECVLQLGDKASPPTNIIQFWGHGDPALEQTIWMDGISQMVVPQNVINQVLEHKSPALTGKRPCPENIKVIAHREQLGTWLNEQGMLGAGAEIGVMHGGYSESVLKIWNGEKYYMVDLWGRQDPQVYRERTDDIDYEGKYRDCVAIAERFPIVQIIRDYSVAAAGQVPDGSLDWVFIDANHSYRTVLEDMDAWFPKLKPGGVFAGHDYGDDTNYPHWCEVKSAVDRWMGEHNIAFRVTECSSWWSIKPL
jgi:hypothetical protein